MNNDMSILGVKFGQIAVLATNDSHIYASSNPESGRNFLPFEVRGVSYIVTAHLHKDEQGVYRVDPKYLHVRRQTNDWKKADNVSNAAKSVIRIEIEDAVNTWALSNADTIRAAHVSACDDRINSLTNKITEKLKEVAELQAEILKLQQERDSK